MHSPIPSSVLLLISAVTVQAFENFNATYGSTPEPFKISVNRDFVETTKLKASLTRYPVDIDLPPLEDGPTHQNVTAVRDFWVYEYDWQAVCPFSLRPGIKANSAEGRG